ncbi:MAG: ATP-binding protein [Oscillospiraceae bacterium]|nr:ATP-binding protein [Oscillospiraceae bacterium]
MTDLNTILTQPGPGEHRGTDGLIHCDACGSARQVVLTFPDRTLTVRCLCSCQNHRREQQRRDLRQQEELDRFARIRSAAMADPALGKCTFAASRYDGPVMQAARNYVDQWPRMEEQGTGLLLWGSVGTGKTYIAACIANALLDRGVPVLMTSFGRILGAMPGPASGQQTAQLDEWMRYPLLIIDDLGVERDTPYTMELVYHIIDARYRSGKPMIITTNLTMEELGHPDSREKMRIYDRVLERCTPIRVESAHIRGQKRKENRSLARELLVK